jgi:hypothetical protein
MTIIKEHFSNIADLNGPRAAEPDYIIMGTTCVLRFKDSKDFDNPAKLAQLFQEATRDFPRARLKDITFNHLAKRLEIHTTPHGVYKKHGTAHFINARD